MKELAKHFDFKTVDAKWAELWEEKNLFHAKAEEGKEPYTIVIPPPNVTGILHMGHALNNTLQDIVIRYKRMKGFETLWMPGTDHAGIATQNVVEKQLAKEGKNRQDLGREKFTERLWSWKKEYGDTIINQLKKIGASCDWQRMRFTMDDDYSDAVKEVFIRLFQKGLVYRGTYIINWCPRCHTALSDEEAEHQETKGKLYHIRYPFKDDPEIFLTVATTRPETMLGDTAVAVNPKDKRYKDLIGQMLILPLVNREIPVIADDFVDMEFGTGAVKVTPAHDPNDYAMGKRHNLEFINIMHPDGVINKEGWPYENQDRFTARKNIVADLEKQGLLVKIDDHDHAVGHCYRCDTIVEPYLSKQWFVKMAPLAKPAIEAVEDGRITFSPPRWKNFYMNWMENIRDWCISRQIWWGHRIPVWYCQDCDHIMAEKQAPEKCASCGSSHLEQDEDVLDTWFSSWLWPFATLGWPKENADLKFFYPTSSLFTASEIIFFWVARMIMAGFEFMGDIPFSDVYIHGTVRDSQGRKMSKSLGNAIDPLEIVREYGADALRFSLIVNSGQDLFISKEKFEIGRNFANKIWNASRLILMRIEEETEALNLDTVDQKELDLPSRWILSRLYTTIANVSEAIEHYRYSEAENLIYDFFWNNFCDWYLEIIKNRWDDKTIQALSLRILEESLKLIHPFMPFVTEEVWETIHGKNKELCRRAWPETRQEWINPTAEKQMQMITDVVNRIRNWKIICGLKQNETVDCVLTADTETLSILKENAENIRSNARIKQLTVEKTFPDKDGLAKFVVGNVKGAITVKDISQVRTNLEAQLQTHKKQIAAYTKKLGNENFVSKAPADLVENTKNLKACHEKEKETIENYLKDLV